MMEEELNFRHPEFEEVTVERDTRETAQENAVEVEDESGYPLDPDYLAQKATAFRLGKKFM